MSRRPREPQMHTPGFGSNIKPRSGNLEFDLTKAIQDASQLLRKLKNEPQQLPDHKRYREGTDFYYDEKARQDRVVNEQPVRSNYDHPLNTTIHSNSNPRFYEAIPNSEGPPGKHAKFEAEERGPHGYTLKRGPVDMCMAQVHGEHEMHSKPFAREPYPHSRFGFGTDHLREEYYTSSGRPSRVDSPQESDINEYKWQQRRHEQWDSHKLPFRNEESLPASNLDPYCEDHVFLKDKLMSRYKKLNQNEYEPHDWELESRNKKWIDNHGNMASEHSLSILPSRVIHCMNTVPVMETSHASIIPPMESDESPIFIEKPKGCKTIFIGGLPLATTNEVVEGLFQCFGRIKKLILRESKAKQAAKFCHLKFDDCTAVDKSLKFAGHYIIVANDPKNPDNVSKIIVDYATDRFDQMEYEEKMTELKGTDHKAISIRKFDSLLKSLHNLDEFSIAASLLSSWCEQGLCTKSYVNKFYNACSAVNMQVREVAAMARTYKLLVLKHREKEVPTEGSIKEKCEAFEKVFKAFRIQKVWGSFTKGQRKTIQQYEENYRKEMKEIEKILNIRGTVEQVALVVKDETITGTTTAESELTVEDDMEIEEEDEEPNNSNILETVGQAPKGLSIEEENNYLKTQVEALRAIAEKNLDIEVQLERLRREYERYTVETKSTLLEKDDRIMRLETSLQSLYQYTCYGITGAWPDVTHESYTSDPEEATRLLLETAQQQQKSVRIKSDIGERQTDLQLPKADTDATTTEEENLQDTTVSVDSLVPKTTDSKPEQEEALGQSEDSDSFVSLSSRELSCIPIFTMVMNTYLKGISAKRLSRYCQENGVTMSATDVKLFLEKLPKLFCAEFKGNEEVWFFIGLKTFK